MATVAESDNLDDRLTIRTNSAVSAKFMKVCEDNKTPYQHVIRDCMEAIIENRLTITRKQPTDNAIYRNETT